MSDDGDPSYKPSPLVKAFYSLENVELIALPLPGEATARISLVPFVLVLASLIIIIGSLVYWFLFISICEPLYNCLSRCRVSSEEAKAQKKTIPRKVNVTRAHVNIHPHMMVWSYARFMLRTACALLLPVFFPLYIYAKFRLAAV